MLKTFSVPLLRGQKPNFLKEGFDYSTLGDGYGYGYGMIG